MRGQSSSALVVISWSDRTGPDAAGGHSLIKRACRLVLSLTWGVQTLRRIFVPTYIDWSKVKTNDTFSSSPFRIVGGASIGASARALQRAPIPLSLCKFRPRNSVQSGCFFRHFSDIISRDSTASWISAPIRVFMSHQGSPSATRCTCVPHSAHRTSDIARCRLRPAARGTLSRGHRASKFRGTLNP